MPEPSPALAVRNVAKAYGPVVALRRVDLTVHAGEIHALLGANGAGKSTLVKILAGVIPMDAGSVAVEGAPVTVRTPTDAARYRIATVFQDPSLIPDLTVADNLRLTRADDAEVQSWLEHLGLPEVDRAALVRELPLAVQRMLDLARALASDPTILLLDEITATLPADLAERVFEVIAEQRNAGRAIVFISHRLAEVLEHCDRATVLRDGEDVDAFVPTDGGERRMVQAMMGHDVSSVDYTGGTTQLGEPRLTVTDLGLDDTVRDVSFALRGGEILGIAALEGQGQDELFSLLSGSRRPTAGRIEVNGDELHARSPFDAIRRGVVLVPSDRLAALLPQRSVHENLASALYNRPARWWRIDRHRERQRVEGAIDRLSIDTRAKGEVRRLSGGNQQKVTIGRWLAAGFSTLLCFDPTRGIDVGTKQQIYELLREVAEEGSAVLLYSSELREIPLVCDRALVMYGGRIVDEQQATEADERSLLAAAHGLQDGEVRA